MNKQNERVACTKVSNLGDTVLRTQQVELTCDIVAMVNKLQRSIMKLSNFQIIEQTDLPQFSSQNPVKGFLIQLRAAEEIKWGFQTNPG